VEFDCPEQQVSDENSKEEIHTQGTNSRPRNQPRNQRPVAKTTGCERSCAGLKKINATGMELKSSTSRAKRNVQTNTDVPTENETHELQIHQERKANTIKQDARPSLSIESNTIFV
jgi:hypothetical protein